MKKFVTSLLAMVMLLSLCTGCGGQKDSSSTGDTASAGTPSAETVVLRLANSHNAEHITSQACQMFADLVNEKTDGRITIECHFAGELGRRALHHRAVPVRRSGLHPCFFRCLC